MTEREQAIKIANMWLDGRMNAFTQMVPGDPDCDACVLARQFLRLRELADALKRSSDPVILKQGGWPAAGQSLDQHVAAMKAFLDG